MKSSNHLHAQAIVTCCHTTINSHAAATATAARNAHITSKNPMSVTSPISHMRVSLSQIINCSRILRQQRRNGLHVKLDHVRYLEEQHRGGAGGNAGADAHAERRHHAADDGVEEAADDG